MIIVKNGFTLEEHAPTTYNYRFQSVQSPIMRTLQYPLDSISPKKCATTTTGFPVYLTGSADTAEIPVAGFQGNESVDFYMSWRSTRGSGHHERIYSLYNESAEKYSLMLWDDDTGSHVQFSNISYSPILIAICTERLEMLLYGVHEYEYAAMGAYLAYRHTGYDGTPRISKTIIDPVGKRFNSVSLAQTGTNEQQDYLYTVSGGAQ